MDHKFSVRLGCFHTVALDCSLISPQVYIHCKLVAWDPEVFDIEKKACHYIKETGE